MNTQTYIASTTRPKTLAGQAGFEEAQIRGGDGLVPGSHGETPKPRGRGRPRPFLESVFLAGRLRTACTTSLLPLLLVLALPATLHAQFTYTTNGGTVTITGYTGPGGAVTIPDTITGLPVTSIGNEAFYNGRIIQPYILTSITIPDSVTGIGDLAFAGCSRLQTVYFLGNAPSLGGSSVFQGDYNIVYYLSGTSGWGQTFGGRPTALWFWLPCTYTTNISAITITRYIGVGETVNIPNAIHDLPVASIGSGAFSNCASLTSVTIPDSVMNIGDAAFAYCGKLTGVFFQGDAPSLGSSVFKADNNIVYYLTGTAGWGQTFGGRPTTLWLPYTYTTNNGAIIITGYTGTGGTVTIPSTINGRPVTSIGDDAFSGCTSLNSITIPNSVTNIGYEAFDYCSSLTSVKIPESVTSIGASAFNGCTNLASVAIGTNVSSIGDDAFSGCTSLTSITIPCSVTNIGGWVFSVCSNLKSITVDALNAAYSSLDGVLFNKSRTTLIEYPCGKGASYTIPNSVASIGDGAFGLCTGLSSVTIPNSVLGIGDNTFYNCTRLTNVAIPNGVTHIGSGAFSYCASLTSVTIPDGVTSLGSSAFNSCTSLTNVTIGKSVTSMGDFAFAYCYSLASVTIPNSVASIGGDAFYNCTSLTSVTIPNSVANMGVGAFSYCTSVTSVRVGSGVTNLEGWAFDGCSSLTNVTLGTGVRRIEDRAFCGCTNLNGVYFEGNAPSLGGSFVFAGDTHATVYYLPGTAGWGPTFGDRPTAKWFLPNPLILTIGPFFGVQNNRFRFIISWATNLPVVVEVCTNLANPTWSPLSSNTLTGGSSYFSDPQWANYPARFYRVRWP